MIFVEIHDEKKNLHLDEYVASFCEDYICDGGYEYIYISITNRKLFHIFHF